MSISVGIVISFVIVFFITLFGYDIVYMFNRFSWIMAVIAIVIATGCGGKHLSNQVQQPKADAPLILDYCALIAGFSLSIVPLMSDTSVYFRPDSPP